MSATLSEDVKALKSLVLHNPVSYYLYVIKKLKWARIYI